MDRLSRERPEESLSLLNTLTRQGLTIAERAKAGDQSLKAAPVYAPRRRLDETLAARKPVLTYREPEPAAAAAE
jgi:glycine dehydrogenase subunit 2